MRICLRFALFHILIGAFKSLHYLSDDEIGTDSDPDMDFYRIFRMTPKRLNVKVLLYPIVHKIKVYTLILIGSTLGKPTK
jgi:hypothetical protein